MKYIKINKYINFLQFKFYFKHFNNFLKTIIQIKLKVCLELIIK